MAISHQVAVAEAEGPQRDLVMLTGTPPKNPSLCFTAWLCMALKPLGLAGIKLLLSCGIFCHQELEISPKILS